MKFDKLYANASNGKIKVWEIEADNDTMIIRNGYLDGKIAVQTKKIKGKSIGRSNETSDIEQCILECKAKWQKKIDEQYTPNKNKIKEYSEQKVLLPMLALDYHKRKHDISFPCYVQPKLNGVRCIYQNGKFMSRKGKEFTTLSHLLPEVKGLGINIPDGEIYVHGMTFQKIVRLLKKYRPGETEKLEYWIYDQINNNTFQKRTDELFQKLDKTKHLIRVPTIVVKSEKEIKELHDKWIKEGYEGVIVRNINGLYKVKHMSKDLQKFKEFADAEFEIVGGHEGSGPDEGTIVFEVKTKDNKIFSVRPKGTREERIVWMKDIKNLIGKELTIRYQNLSEDGIPVFPVGISIRDYE
jgi:DNA ligase-1